MFRSMSPHSTNDSTRRATSSPASATPGTVSSGRADPGAAARPPARGRQLALALDDRIDLVRRETVRFFVHAVRGRGVRCFDEAVDLVVLLIEPVVDVLHAVFVLR